jgi:hypothetical protein
MCAFNHRHLPPQLFAENSRYFETAGASAMIAQDVAEAEMNWSVPWGKPDSK